MKKTALTLALLAGVSSAPASEGDGYWFAANLMQACELTEHMRSNPEEAASLSEKDDLAAGLVAVTCLAYLRGFAEAVAIAGEYEAGGACIDATTADVNVLAAQLVATGKANSSLVAPNAPSADLIVETLKSAHPCQ